MDWPLTVAQADAVGVSITSLVGSLGAAGAAVAVTYYFLAFLKTMGDTVQKQLDALAARAEAMSKFNQEQNERLVTRYEQTVRDQQILMREVVASIERITRQPPPGGP